jgi:hypothetical protein
MADGDRYSLCLFVNGPTSPVPVILTGANVPVVPDELRVKAWAAHLLTLAGFHAGTVKVYDLLQADYAPNHNGFIKSIAVTA